MEHFPESSTPQYNRRTLTSEDLQLRILSHGEPIHVNKVLDAYEMASSVHAGKLRNDGTAYFDHLARTAMILMDELRIHDTDVIVAALLHDVMEDSRTITRNVLEYNFGSYVAYIVETLTKDLDAAKVDPERVDMYYAERLRRASQDCLLIKLSARLDNFRCLSFNLKKNPHLYVSTTLSRYVPIAETSSDPRLQTLATMIRNEANTVLG
jgi:(p)ppGpp synthase/HD superfamily hydrolase